jgi:hypothetical protein
MARLDGAGLANVGIGRFAAFYHDVIIEGPSLVAATWIAHVRAKPDDVGTPLAVIAVSAVTYTAGNNYFTLTCPAQSWPSATETGDDVKLSWDLKRTDGGDQIYFYGDFIVHAGVAQP